MSPWFKVCTLKDRPCSRTTAVLKITKLGLKLANKPLIGFWPKPEGAAILFRPDGNEGFRVVGRVEAETWTALAGGTAKP